MQARSACSTCSALSPHYHLPGLCSAWGKTLVPPPANSRRTAAGDRLFMLLTGFRERCTCISHESGPQAVRMHRRPHNILRNSSPAPIHAETTAVLYKNLIPVFREQQGQLDDRFAINSLISREVYIAVFCIFYCIELCMMQIPVIRLSVGPHIPPVARYSTAIITR